ncbi:MAG: hypothetical protein NTV94_10510 [Planctomycetota bacterium]|nr:hypothetical protein [Planctomycetota bacterium]
MSTLSFIRTLRTPHSERYLLRQAASEIGALDVHFRTGGSADATVIIFESSGLNEQDIPALLTQIDEVILPDLSISEKNVSFTVVVGRVLGAFTPDAR